ncbi:hypothetical protein [Sphingobacterium yanglingense]|uniref:Uncharacterized protein n=1 Tax=Sphingobacterium yanglingense TaxID=1437280 RepID=A0A4R6WLH3_9SPHI|nr:hypothetical protein [Sphingobacterium yanglingense]TDQ79592.1 hypothetical protein CLV99_1037 [Sphingobacterium yanglingense]
MAVETLTRTVESNSEQRVSKAVFKGFNLTFTEERQLGKLIKVEINGYKQTAEGMETVSLHYDTRNGGQPSISFSPLSAVDSELANAISAELEVIKAVTE